MPALAASVVPVAMAAMAPMVMRSSQSAAMQAMAVLAARAVLLRKQLVSAALVAPVATVAPHTRAA